MSGKPFAAAATSAFMDTRHGSPRLHWEKPIRCLPDFAFPQPTSPTAATRRAAPRRRAILALLPLEPDRAEDDDALEDELQVRIDIVQPHDVVDDSDDQHADERAADRSGSAREARSADDDRGDRIELVRDAVVGIALLELR